VPRVGADEKLQRLLALVPWVAAHDGPSLAEVCARFACTETELVEDLRLLFLCGLHPYTPDTLIDVDVADGRVWIRYAWPSAYCPRIIRSRNRISTVMSPIERMTTMTPSAAPRPTSVPSIDRRKTR